MGTCEGHDRIPGWAEIRQLPDEWELYKRLVDCMAGLL